MWDYDNEINREFQWRPKCEAEICKCPHNSTRDHNARFVKIFFHITLLDPYILLGLDIANFAFVAFAEEMLHILSAKALEDILICAQFASQLSPGSHRNRCHI